MNVDPKFVEFCAFLDSYSSLHSCIFLTYCNSSKVISIIPQIVNYI